MEKLTFRTGDVILYDGLYRCGDERCDHQVWGVAGRNFPRLGCGHAAEWRLVRRRADRQW